jgi:dihydrofolate reductase
VRTRAITQNISSMARSSSSATGSILPLRASNWCRRRGCTPTAAMLLGRQTFEDFRGNGPQQTDHATGITDELDHVHTYVVSTTMIDPRWPSSTILASGLLDEVRALKDQPGRDIVVTGNIRVMGSIDAGLVDGYRLFVHPVAQGRGCRLVPDGDEVSRLRTVQSEAFGNGVALLRYACT